MLEHGRQRLLVDRLESLAFRTQRRIQTAGGPGNRFERRLVEPRFDEAAGLVFHETAAALGRERNEIALRRTHTDGVDFEAVFLRGGLGRDQCLAFEVFPVRDQYQNLVAAGTPPQRGLGFMDGAGDIGAAARDGVDVDDLGRGPRVGA